MRKYTLPLVSACMLGYAVWHVVHAQPLSLSVSSPVEPSRTPFAAAVAGAGLVEAQTENIALGSPQPGIVWEVCVRVGQRVKVGDGLFRLDERTWRAEQQVRLARLQVAREKLGRLEASPRSEELPVKEARIRESQANLEMQRDHALRARQMLASGAIGAEEHVARQQTLRLAQEQLQLAQADYELLRAGAWERDKIVARAEVAQAQAEVEQACIELERATIRALVEGEVLQVNVRPGEFVATPSIIPPVVLGNLDRLHVRVDIAEQDIPRFRPGAAARAMPRGQPDEEIALSFLRVEPFVVPKHSLTGESREQVDTRVLQVIYAAESRPRLLYVGQQVDVFIECVPRE